MNKRSNTTTAQPLPTPFHPADDVNRARAIVQTVWLALNSQSYDGYGDEDTACIGDTLYEAMERLARAEKNMGVHR